MIRFSTVLLMLGTLAPQGSLAAQDSDDSSQKFPVTQSAAPDADTTLNKQILQTLTDIRDSQLSVLQAQVEILSILRAQEKTVVTASSHDPASVSGRHAAKKRHESRSGVNLSAAR